MSKEEAWEVMAVEILTDAGLVAPNHPEGVPVPARTESIQVSIEEAKLLRPLRIEPHINGEPPRRTQTRKRNHA